MILFLAVRCTGCSDLNVGSYHSYEGNMDIYFSSHMIELQCVLYMQEFRIRFEDLGPTLS